MRKSTSFEKSTKNIKKQQRHSIMSDFNDEYQKKAWDIYLKFGKIQEPILMKTMKVSFLKAQELVDWCRMQRHLIATQG